MFDKRDSFVATITKTTDFMARPHGKKLLKCLLSIFTTVIWGTLQNPTAKAQDFSLPQLKL